MKDVISYTDNLPELIAWLIVNADTFPDFIILDDEGEPRLNLDKVPVSYNGDHSVTLLRVDDAAFAAIQVAPVDILAECETGTAIAFDLVDAEGQDKISLAYDRSPVHFIDDEGNPEVYTPPYNFGVFA